MTIPIIQLPPTSSSLPDGYAVWRIGRHVAGVVPTENDGLVREYGNFANQLPEVYRSIQAALWRAIEVMCNHTAGDLNGCYGHIRLELHENGVSIFDLYHGAEGPYVRYRKYEIRPWEPTAGSTR